MTRIRNGLVGFREIKGFMEGGNMNFEQVPVEIAIRAAAKEAATKHGRRNWIEIAEQICREDDQARILELVVQLNEALEAREM